ncbi:MAG: hypothetical protein EOR99_03735 [Mesorhizobium sp.]|nr:MAG: hypothetical protein EOR99_03735 [Mesorhizobium sp.]
MTTINELSRLEQQATNARLRLENLLLQREAGLEGGGLVPAPSEVDRARDRLEAAQRLLEAHVRMAVRT